MDGNELMERRDVDELLSTVTPMLNLEVDTHSTRAFFSSDLSRHVILSDAVRLPHLQQYVCQLILRRRPRAWLVVGPYWLRLH
jgi:hypothetical protein